MLNRKLLALLLSAALLLPLTSCGDTATETTADTAAADTVPVETETEKLPSGLPDMDLNGFVLTFLRSGVKFIEKGIWTEELTGDAVPDAIYERNLFLEEAYNCSIEIQESPSQHPNTEIEQYVMGGDDTVDVLMDGGQFIAANSQNFMDLNSLQYFDFSQPWWNKEFNEGISLGGRLYFTVGAYGTTAKGNIFHVIFNKQVARDNGIDPDSMYNHVYEDTWTLDQMTEYAALVKSDLNGDGTYDTNDLWGLIGENYITWTLALGAGFRCADKDENDLPIVTFNTEHNLDILNTVMALAGSREYALFAQRMTGVADVWSAYSVMAKTDGCWLFRVGSLGDNMREMEDDYGVLPSPKYDEMQDRYYHDASLGNSPTTAVPISCSDADTVSFLLEAMSYESFYRVLPVFYDNYMHTKLVRDEESVEMLKIVHDTLYYDIGALFNWGDMRMMIENMVDRPENTIASTYAANEKRIQTDLENTIKRMSES